MSARPFRVLIPFNTTEHLYGLERAVIEIFDLLRPDIEPLFIVDRNKGEPDHAVIQELQRRGMAIARFSDRDHWPRMSKPKSIPHLAAMLKAFILGNRDVFRHTASCDALYLPGLGYGAFALASMLRYRNQGKPVVHQFHEFGLHPSRQLEALNHLVTDHVHATNCGLQTVAALNPGILKRRNHIIPMRVELPHCEDAPDMLHAFEGRINLVYAGQMCLTKGVDILLDGFALLAPRHPELRLHLIGSFQGEGSEAIEERLKGESDNISVWGYREDVPAFFRHAYLALQSTPPSRYRESFGRTAAEAALCGTPVVCFASGALSEIVIDGVTGTVCKEESRQALAAGIESYLKNPAQRAQHGAAALQRITEADSLTRIREAWLNCFGV